MAETMTSKHPEDCDHEFCILATSPYQGGIFIFYCIKCIICSNGEYSQHYSKEELIKAAVALNTTVKIWPRL